MTVSFMLDGEPCEVDDERISLLEALRERLGRRSPKDGCSPQGQCGCCTVLVDGQPRVACVTPLRRVAGRQVTTVDGLASDERDRWARAFCDTGASQCGFCTPGIVLRLEALRRRGVGIGDHAAVEQALLAHLCRCTGWRTILEAWDAAVAAATTALVPDVAITGATAFAPAGEPTAAAITSATAPDGEAAAALAPAGDAATAAGAGGGAPGSPPTGRDLAAAAHRARLEGGVAQRVAPEVALGRGGFADDLAPPDAVVAVPLPLSRAASAAARGEPDLALGPTVAAARAAAGTVPGRHTTHESRPPLDPPAGDWTLTLQTGWVEPAYLETDASWCGPGGEPASPLANGGAFGGKADSPVAGAARRLADEHGAAVRLLWSREDTVRLGPKRPPLAAGIDRDARRVAVRVVRTPGVADALAAGLGPGVQLEVDEVDVAGPPTSCRLRAAGWAEGVVLRAALDGAPGEVVAPGGGWARATLDGDGTVRISVDAGRPLDEVVLRSYCIGAAHMALGWVTSEGITVDADGAPLDLTIRSFGILRAVDTPPIEVDIQPSERPPVPVSEAVFAAVAAATWAAQGFPPVWPTGRRLR